MKVALICCGRLENRYAVEFVEYYKQLGFDHIFIADNNRGEEEHFEDVLQSYIDDKFVTIYDYRSIDGYCQYVSYIDIYYKISNDYDWILTCDFDEFLTLVKDKNIKDYLSRECFNKANQILINWKIYTDNDLIYDDGRSCLERFTQPMEIHKYIENDWLQQNEIIKPIIRTNIKDINLNTIHLFDNDLLQKTTYNSAGYLIKDIKYWQPINYTLAYIKHFTTKTIDEWVNSKLVRGTGDRDREIFEKTYNIDLFFKYNDLTEEKIKYLKNHNINYNHIKE